jgi:hypothetical protein
MQLPAHPTNQWSLLAGPASVVAVVVFAAKTFEWLDPMVSDRGREAMTRWLSNAPDDAEIDSWATIFPRLIDRVFGARALSLKFLLRSCVASVLAVTSVTLLFYILIGGRKSQASIGIYVLGALFLGAIANFFPDYLSILVTRTIVRILEKKPTLPRICTLVILDTLITAIVAEVAIYLLLALIVGAIGLIAQHSLGLLLDFLQPRFFNRFLLLPLRAGFYSNLFSIFFFSAFFTSTWLWLYVISISLIRTAHRARSLWIKLLPFLDIEEKPLVAIGRVAGLLSGAVYAMLLGAVWLARHWH